MGDGPLSKALLRSTVTVGLNTTLSRVLGLVRDIVIARIFGTGVGADAFFVAFRIPNFLRRLFAEGAFSQAFVPVLAEYRSQHSPEAVRELAQSTAGVLGGILFLVTAVGVIAAPVLVMIFAPGFVDEAEKYELTVSMLRITFPYLLFISLTSLAGGILNTYGLFSVPAFTPVLLNIFLIGAATLLAPHLQQPITALAWGVLLGGVAQLCFQFPFLYRQGFLCIPRLNFRHPGVRKIFKLILPAIFGVSVSQINLLVDTLIASFLVTGSVSWLYYSDRLVEFPLGVFGIALATVILPNLSRKHAEGAGEAFAATLDWALRWVVLIAVPAAIGLMFLATPILATLFQYGAFDAHGVAMSSLSLMAYALGLPAFVLVKILAPGFYARQDTRTPVRVGVIAMLANIVLNLALVFPLAHTGLALATSIAAWLNAGLLYRGLRKLDVCRPLPGWGLLWLRVLVAGGSMAAMLWWWRGELAQWIAWGIGDRVLALGSLVIGGAALYGLLLLLGGFRPYSLVLRDKGE